MSIESEIARLGGIESIIEGKYWSPSKRDISIATAAFGQHLPKDYIDFVSKYGCSSLKNLVHFDFPKNVPVYTHDPALGFPKPPGPGGGAISHFYGGRENGNANCSLAAMIERLAKRMPEGFVPIAAEGGGNQICLGHSMEGTPGVYFWDHENEWDVDDYIDDTGSAMPEAAKYQNMYFLTETLEDLFKMLRISNA